MVLKADKNTLGVPDFKIIDIDPTEVAKSLQVYVDRGSRLTGVSLDDIRTSVSSLPSDPKTATLVDLLERGMKLFDALVWLTAGRPASHPLTVDATMGEDKIPSLHQVAQAVFYVYFFLLTQARYPVRTGDQNPPKVPNFLNTVMGLNEPQGHYVSLICSFNPVKFNAKWAEQIKFAGLGQETLSRFGLGVAGYRLFGPFKLYTPKPDLSEDLMRAVTFAQTVSRAKPSWNVHPLTRSPNVLTARGNLNKNLSNLILDVFTDEQIDEMVSAKVLFQRPQREPSQRNYLQWAATDDITGEDVIFEE